MTELSIIVAINENEAIGFENKLPWRLPNDMKRFKALTMGKACIMGRKTWESIGKPLPGRTNIVLTQNRSYSVNYNEVMLVNDPYAAIAAAYLGRDEEIMIIGGQYIYSTFRGFATKIYLTVVHENKIGGDRWFSKPSRLRWRMTEEIRHPKDSRHEYDYSFQTWVRK